MVAVRAVQPTISKHHLVPIASHNADAKHDDVKELAEKFTRRFPEILRAAQGDDWNYARWYVKMLGYAERGMFPIAYADWYEEPDPRFLPLSGFESDLPMPPPGDVQGRREA